MSRIFSRVLFTAAVLGIGPANLATANDGHEHGNHKHGNKEPDRKFSAPKAHDGHEHGNHEHGNKEPDRKFSAPKSRPFGSRFDSRRERFGPYPPESSGPCFRRRICDGPGRLPSFGSVPRPRPVERESLPVERERDTRDLRTLAFHLEFAAEIVSEEVRFDMARTRFPEQLLASAADVEKQSRHFRASVDKGDDADHLRKDFQAVTESFAKLARPPERLHNSLLVGRAIYRVDVILADISRQLKTADMAVNEQPPGTPQPAPNTSQEPSPRQPAPNPHTSHEPSPRPPVIPEEAKGIALLPLADQAAALAQRTCPITDELLGAHGKPLKVQLRDRTVFVCCEGCVDDLKAESE